MTNIVPNIEKSQKIELIVWGVLLLITVIIGISRVFSLIIGAALVVQGILGWSVVPYLIKKLNLKI